MTARFSCVEALAAVAGGMLAVALVSVDMPRAFAAVTLAVITALMVAWIAWQDLMDMTIPDGPLIALAALGAAHRLVASYEGIGPEGLSIVMDACLCGGALWILRETYFRLRGVDGLGFGDVKLAAAGGILAGVIGFSWALFLASVGGLLVVFVASFLKPQRSLDRLPFGAFLAPMCWVVWIYGL